MDNDSLWLGRLQTPVKYAAIVCGVATALMYTFLVINKIFDADAIGMFEMIRPQGRPLVAVMLGSITLTMLFSSLYLSDFKGAIESKPDGFFDILSLITSRISMIAIAVIVLVMFYEVVARYIFSAPTLWANEMSLWVASFVFLLAGQYAMQQRSHIRIYVIYDMMPRWGQKTSDVISTALILFFAFSLVWGGYTDAETRFMRMETFGTYWDPPIPGIIKPAILFIISLVAVQAVSNLISDWHKAPEHLAHDDIDEIEIENIKKTLEQ